MANPNVFTVLKESPAHSALLESPAHSALDAVPIDITDVQLVTLAAYAPSAPYGVLYNPNTSGTADYDEQAVRRFGTASHTGSFNWSPDYYGAYPLLIGLTFSLSGAGQVLIQTSSVDETSALDGEDPWAAAHMIYSDGTGPQWNGSLGLASGTSSLSATDWYTDWQDTGIIGHDDIHGDYNVTATKHIEYSVSAEFSWSSGFDGCKAALTVLTLSDYFNGVSGLVGNQEKYVDGCDWWLTDFTLSPSTFGTGGGWTGYDPLTFGFQSFDGQFHALGAFGTPGQADLGSNLPVSLLSGVGGNILTAQLSAVKPVVKHAYTLAALYKGPSCSTGFYKPLGVGEIEPATIFTVPFPSEAPPFRLTTGGSEYLITEVWTMLLLESSLTDWMTSQGIAQTRLLPP